MIVTHGLARADVAVQDQVQRTRRAIDTFQQCIGGQGLPSAHGDLAVKDALLRGRNIIALDLFNLAPDIYKQWLKRFESPIQTGDSLAVHETSHFVNAILRACKPDVTGYYFFGDVFFINTRPSETPNYSRVDDLLPSELGVMRKSFRYEHYILNSRQYKGNDLRMLLDELLSSIAGATAESLAYSTQSAEASSEPNPVLVNADIIGAQEFAVYVALYLRDLKSSMPAAYQRVICSADGPAVLKHAWERLELIRESQAKQDRSHFSPRARQTPPEVTEFLTSDAAQSMFKNPCDGVR